MEEEKWKPMTLTTLPGQLTLRIKDGELRTPSVGFHLYEPYLVLKQTGEQKETIVKHGMTKLCKKTVKPVWNEEFTFYLPRMWKSSIVIEGFSLSSNFGSGPESLGAYRLKVRDLVNSFADAEGCVTGSRFTGERSVHLSSLPLLFSTNNFSLKDTLSASLSFSSDGSSSLSEITTSPNANGGVPDSLGSSSNSNSNDLSDDNSNLIKGDTHMINLEFEIVLTESTFERLLQPPDNFFGQHRMLADDYIVTKKLSAGVNWKLYQCTSRKTNEVCVVKEIPKKAVDHSIEYYSFIQHPCIIRLIGQYEHAKALFFVMEPALGGTLSEKVNEIKFCQEGDAVEIIKRVLSGLVHAHERGVFHGDLSAENILLTDSKDITSIRIIGFKGVPLTLAQHERNPAPEVLTKKGKEEFGSHVDMWSVGVLTYFLLCGARPFRGIIGNIAEYSTKAEYYYDADAKKRISDAAKNFIASLLLVDPTKRMTAKQAKRHPWLAPTTFKRGVVLQKESSMKSFSPTPSHRTLSSDLRAQMMKRPDDRRDWKQRELILKDKLYYANSDNKVLGHIEISSGTEIAICNSKKCGKPFCFTIKAQSSRHFNQARRLYHFAASSEKMRSEWKAALEELAK